MHFTSVDLPAPLSPTSAVTCPAYAEKSTPFRTWTGPKLLLMCRISRMGSSATPVHPSVLSRPRTQGAAAASSGGGHPSCSCYLTPAAVHLATYVPVHNELFGVSWSLIGWATLALVIAIGVASRAGTGFLVCGSVIVTPPVSGTWPLASWAIALMAGSASSLDGL